MFLLLTLTTDVRKKWACQRCQRLPIAVSSCQVTNKQKQHCYTKPYAADHKLESSNLFFKIIYLVLYCKTPVKSNW